MQQENQPQLPDNQPTLADRLNRWFGAEIQLVTSLDSACVTAVNWPQVNQSHCERVHVMAEQRDEAHNRWLIEKETREHDHAWHVDLAENYLKLADRCCDQEGEIRQAKDERDHAKRQYQYILSERNQLIAENEWLWRELHRLDPSWSAERPVIGDNLVEIELPMSPPTPPPRKKFKEDDD